YPTAPSGSTVTVVTSVVMVPAAGSTPSTARHHTATVTHSSTRHTSVPQVVNCAYTAVSLASADSAAAESSSTGDDSATTTVPTTIPPTTTVAPTTTTIPPATARPTTHRPVAPSTTAHTGAVSHSTC